MQLKPLDAVKCKTKEEWAEIVNQAALNDIEICALFNFADYPILVINENMRLDSHTEGNYCMPSYAEFLAKLKGEWEEDNKKSSDFIELINIGLQEGKYKLVRCKDE